MVPFSNTLIELLCITLKTASISLAKVPGPDGNMCNTTIFENFDYNAVEKAVKRLFCRIQKYEKCGSPLVHGEKITLLDDRTGYGEIGSNGLLFARYL